jgi:hypothetical protein
MLSGQRVAEVGDDCGGLMRQVCGQARPGQPDDGERAARHKELVHQAEGSAGVHVVQRRDRGDHVEGRGRERVGKEVAADEADLAVCVLAAGQVDARRVPVDAHDLRDKAGQPPGQHSLAAANVQHTLASRWNRRQDQPVVMDVVIPSLTAPGHAR